jgi:hypothetical protein
MTYAELCTRILFEAQRGGEAAEQANLNTQSVIESIMPSLLQDVALKFARTDEGRSLLRVTHTITLAAGVGVVPPEALTQCKWGASVSDPNDITVAQTQSLVPEWPDFVQERSGIQSELVWWTIKGDGDFHYLASGETYDPTLGFDGDIELTIASVPVMPTDPDLALDWPEEIQTDIIDLGSEWLRGMKIPI